MSFSFADHLHEILNEIICPFEGWAGLAERRQILLFDLVQAVGVSDKQPDSGAGGKRVETVGIEGSLNARLFERFQMAIDRPFCSGVTLLLDFTPEHQTISLSLLPPFEH